MEVSQKGDLVRLATGKAKRSSSVREVKVIKTYDPFQEPADIEMAAEHGKAKRVYRNRKEDKLKTENNKVCPCCGLVIVELFGGDNIPLCGHLEEIYFLGCGFPSYFIFIKYSTILLTSIFGITGLFNLVTNYLDSSCSHSGSDTDCNKGFILSFALSNKKSDPHLLTIFLILNLTSVFFVILFFHVIRYTLRRTEKIVDNATVTPSDYTLELRGVDPTMTNEEVINWLQSFQTTSKVNAVVKINRTYNIKEYVKYTKQKLDLVNKKVKNNVHELEGIDEKIKHVEGKLEEFKNKPLVPTSVLFAVFDNANVADAVRLRFQKGFLRKRFERLLSKFISTFDHLAGRRIVVQRAPEPTEILWENLGYTPYEQFKKKIIVYIVTYALVAAEFLLVVLISWSQEKVKNQAEEDSYTRLLSLCCSILTFLWDILSSSIIKRLASREKNPTLTAYYTEVAGNLSIVQLINIGFTPLLAKLLTAGNFSENLSIKDRFKLVNIYGGGGLIENMYFIFAIHAFFPPLLTILDPAYIYDRFKQRRILNGKKVKLTQSQAHQYIALFEGPDIDIPEKYAYLIRTMLLASFYAPGMPFALIYSTLGLILTYWADKYVLLRRVVLPKVLNNNLTNTMVEYLEWMAFTFATGSLLFSYILEDSSNENVLNRNISSIIIWSTLGISLFHIYFPMEWLNRRIFKITKERTETETYEEARFDFTTDYDIENPITRKKALKEFLFQVRGLIDMGSSAHRFDSAKEGAFAKLTHFDLMQLMNSAAKDEGQDFQFLDTYAQEVQDSAPLLSMVQILSKFNNFRLKHRKSTIVNQFILNAKTLIGICDDMKGHVTNRGSVLSDEEVTAKSPYVMTPRMKGSKELIMEDKLKGRISLFNSPSPSTSDHLKSSDIEVLIGDRRKFDLSIIQIPIKVDDTTYDEEYNNEDDINSRLRQEFAQRRLVLAQNFGLKKT